MSRLMVVLFCCVLFMAEGAAASAEEGRPGDGSSRATWSVKPSDQGEGFEDGRAFFSYEVAAGDVVEDAATITNYGERPLELVLYPVDAFTSSSGRLDARRATERAVSVGLWIDPEKDRVTVPPGESLEVGFVLRIPENSLAGDHAGALITSLFTESESGGVNVDRRLGNRIAVRVLGEINPQISLTEIESSFSTSPDFPWLGDLQVSFQISNVGNIAMSSDYVLRLASLWNIWSYSGQDAVPELLPGESWQVEEVIKGVPPIFGIETGVTLTLNDPGVDAEVLTEKTYVWAFSVPYSILSLSFLLAVVITIVFVRRGARRRKAAENMRISEAVQRALSEHQQERR